MKTYNICLLFSVSLFSFVLSGCFSIPYIQLYSGPRLPNKDVAILRVYGSVTDLIIDGKDISEVDPNFASEDFRHVIALLPGKHEISWNYSRYDVTQDVEVKFEIRGKQTTLPLTLPAVYKGAGTLDAKAGKKYHFDLDYERGALKRSDGITNTYSVTDAETSIKEGYSKYTEDWTPH